jgi:hypothetical protein
VVERTLGKGEVDSSILSGGTSLPPFDTQRNRGSWRICLDDPKEAPVTLKQRLIDALSRGIQWGERRVPWGLRSLLGLVLMAGGVLGFLPILGFWMLPLGVAFIALDIPPLRRRLLDWARRQSAPT